MKIAVCEDELSDQIALRKAFAQAKEELEIDFELEFLQSGRELLERIERGEVYDLAILDIYLKDDNGMETAKRLREFGDTPVAFATVSEEFALEAYSVDPVHYLIKPVDAAGIKELFRRLFKRRGQPLKSLVLRSARCEAEIPLVHIAEITSSDMGVEISLRRGGGVRWYPFPFRETEWIGEEPGFVRIGRGHIVNMEEIFAFDHDGCQMKDGGWRPVSRRERQFVQKKYNSFLFRRLDVGGFGG